MNCLAGFFLLKSENILNSYTNRFSSFALLLVLLVTQQFVGASPNLEKPLNLEQVVQIAILDNAQIAEANAKVEQYRARLLEVQANYYPKLTTMGYVAPMFTVKGGINGVKRDYSLGAWGPSTHFESLLAMPIYSFGRIEAGESAAKSRLAVEKARLREAENHIKVEVKKFYYSYLYASTILPHLLKAESIGADVQIKAQQLYDEATGKVTKVDLMKLKYADAEIKKYILIAKEGVGLALSALKHTMGLADDANLTLIETRIPSPPRKLNLTSQQNLESIAIENRPEWQQIRHGLDAINAFRQSEQLTNKPVLFVAGTLSANWSPTREDATNPYVYDPFNDIFGGVAVGFKMDLDWMLNKAKVKSAGAKRLEILALRQQAITGIPLQIKKARSEVIRFRQQVKLAKKSKKAAKKWIVFSGAAYASGTGEVKDVLEGIVADLTSKRDYYESMLNFYIARAELDYAIGR